MLFNWITNSSELVLSFEFERHEVEDEIHVSSISDRVLLCFFGLHRYFVLQLLSKNLILAEILKSETTCFYGCSFLHQMENILHVPSSSFMCISPQIQPDVCDVFGHSRVLARILNTVLSVDSMLDGGKEVQFPVLLPALSFCGETL